MALPVAETVLDWHALAIPCDQLPGGQPGLPIWRHAQEPGVLETLAAVDDHIHGFWRGAVVEHVTVADGDAGAVWQAVQAEPLPSATNAGPDHDITLARNDIRWSRGMEFLAHRHPGIASIQDQPQARLGWCRLGQPGQPVTLPDVLRQRA